jgi:hypothetical protein
VVQVQEVKRVGTVLSNAVATAYGYDAVGDQTTQVTTLGGETLAGNRHQEGKHDRHQKGKHRSKSLRVAKMPPQGGQGCSRWTTTLESVSCVATG